MRITILIDNTADNQFIAEHGLSYLIEHDGKQLLFDTGHSGAFLKNAENMEIDLQHQVPLIVLSHGHWDHGDGLRFIKEKTLLTHPGSFMKRYREEDHTYIGLALNEDEVKQRFELITSHKPYYITNKIIFLGEIPRTNDFEAQTTSFVDEHGTKDFIRDDSAIALIQDNELVVVSGCAHSGICNILKYAKEISGISNVRWVMGGFHLKKNDKQTQKTISYLKEQGTKQVFPSHCTELPALCAFCNHFHVQRLKTGMVFEIYGENMII